MENILFAVMRLNKDVLINDEKVIDITNDSVAGFIPVYKTYDEAKKNSKNGKYDIIEIKV